MTTCNIENEAVLAEIDKKEEEDFLNEVIIPVIFFFTLFPLQILFITSAFVNR